MSDEPSAVRLLVPEHPNLPRTVRAKLKHRRQQLADFLLNAQSWDDYNKRVGHIRGLDEAIMFCEDAEKAMSE